MRDYDYGVSSGKIAKSDGSIVNIADVIKSIETALSTNKDAVLDNKTILTAIQTLLTNFVSDSLGQNGGTYIDDTNPATPSTGYNFIAIQAIEESVINAATGNISNIAGMTIPQGSIIYGTFTSITLTSGSVIAYSGIDT